MDKIIIKGAKEHNLKNIDLEIPRDKMIVFTGLSGSGKSSLAFDTIYAEGQRRYVESLSAYARQFLGLMEKPDVEYIEGLSPAISIDQKTTSKNPRSTVGTVTEIYDYLRLLYARIGTPYCPKCGKEIKQQTLDQIVDTILTLPETTKIQVLAPIARGKKGEYSKILEGFAKQGFVRVRIDGEIRELGEEIVLNKKIKHNIEIIVDRIILKNDIRKRLTESVETALKCADNLVIIDVIDKEEILFSQNYACPDCLISIDEISPRLFSFNSPFGACPTCTGLGNMMKIDRNLIIPDVSKKLLDNGIIGWTNYTSNDGMANMYIKGLANHYKVDIDKPINQLPEEFINKLLYGTGKEKINFKYESKNHSREFNSSFEGVINILERRYRETSSQGMREYYEQFMASTPCHTCSGTRLKPESLSIKINNKNINDLCDIPINEIKEYINNLELTNKQKIIGEQIFKELNSRLGFLIDVGLDYLTLTRHSGTLSGGEAQRIRLATQIGSGLMGVLYVLDEPSIGLHQRDNEKLLNSLKKMRDLGNTLIIVEHDEDTMFEADYIVDIGPGAGINGGQIIATGTAEQIMKCKESITGKYLSGELQVEIPKRRKKSISKYIEILGARENNLKNVNVKIPLGVFTCITGVSGSGKSSLINEILYKKLAVKLNRAKERPGIHDEIKGIENLDKIINIDQSPIGRTPRSNAATYTGVFDHVRDLFAMTTEAKARAYQKGRFSFNVQGGRCESCSGDGIIKIEMHFLPDVYVPCEVCKGKRYNHETLEIKYKGKSICEVLDMTVQEAFIFFENIPKIKNKLKTLCDVGLGYIRIGQAATTLSGGEAQRIKLASELSRRSTGKTMYILDEPSTGLHMADVHLLIEILQKLVEGGNTVVVIEHNLDIIKVSDHIIDLGPEGGKKGGNVVATGTPENIIKNKNSYTGLFLKNHIEKYKK